MNNVKHAMAHAMEDWEATLDSAEADEDYFFTDDEQSQPDRDSSERDSAYGDDYMSLSTSINSTVTDYKYEHGRRYHAYGEEKYALPNDDEEINRLEIQHRIWQLSLSGQLSLAPLPSNVRSCLDIGCGTGAWAIDFAESHPNTVVVGTDLSPIQPSMVPPNLSFIIDDITKPWVFDHKFDYIHSRAITIGVRDWSVLVDEIWRNLEPGGWVEFQEYHAPWLSDDGSIESAGSGAFATWNQSLAEAAKKAGVRLDAILNVPKLLEARGFVAQGNATTKWPLGKWARGRREKRMGELFLHDILGGLEGLSMRMFTQVLGWSQEEVLDHIKEVADDLRAGKMHAYMPIDILWAQKPADAVD